MSDGKFYVAPGLIASMLPNGGTSYPRSRRCDRSPPVLCCRGRFNWHCTLFIVLWIENTPRLAARGGGQEKKTRISATRLAGPRDCAPGDIITIRFCRIYIVSYCLACTTVATVFRRPTAAKDPSTRCEKRGYRIITLSPYIGHKS